MSKNVPRETSRKTGHTAQKAGARFEELIAVANRYYSSRNLAKIEKIPNGVTAIGRKNGRPVWEATEKTGSDYIGVHQGRGVAFEAKSTRNKTSFPLFTHGKPMVKPHQLAFLIDFQLCGGLSFLLLHFEERGETYRMDPQTYVALHNDAQHAGKKSIPLATIQKHAAAIETKGYILDYLPKKGESEHENEGRTTSDT